MAKQVPNKLWWAFKCRVRIKRRDTYLSCELIDLVLLLGELIALPHIVLLEIVNPCFSVINFLLVLLVERHLHLCDFCLVALNKIVVGVLLLSQFLVSLGKIFPDSFDLISMFFVQLFLSCLDPRSRLSFHLVAQLLHLCLIFVLHSLCLLSVVLVRLRDGFLHVILMHRLLAL